MPFNLYRTLYRILLVSVLIPTTMFGQVDSTFVRYTTPGQCEQAAIRLKKQYWRDKRPDTVVYAPATDSVPKTVIEAVRLCAGRFSVAAVPERELLNLAQLYIWTGQKELIQAVVKRLIQVNTKKPPVEQGWVLYLLVKSLFNSRPTDLVLAQQYLKQLDALGAPAATWRLFAHTELSEYALSINDLKTAELEARAVIVANRQSSRNDRIDWTSSTIQAYKGLATVVALRYTLDANPDKGKAHVLALFDTAAQDLASLYPEGSPDRQRLKNGGLKSEGKPYEILGLQTLPNIEANSWYSAKDYVRNYIADSMDSYTITNTTGAKLKESKENVVRPQPGKASLLVFVNTSCGMQCYPMYASLRRIHEKYTDNLEIILLASTGGYFRRLLMPSPKVESDSTASYFLKFLKLPAIMAVEETKFSYIVDGRRRDEETPNNKNYNRGKDAVLIDKQGTVRWVGDLAPNTESIWNVVIHQTLLSSN